MSLRPRIVLALVPATVRRTPWGTVVGCIAVALPITWLVASRETATTGQILTALRWSAVILTAAVAAALDDPTEDDLAGAGQPIWQRRLLALLLVATPAAAGWAAALVIVDRPLPWVALTLEAAALVLLGIAVASLRRLRTSSIPAGLAAAPLPAVVLIGASFLPPGWALLADPADAEAWRAVHGRWGLLALFAAVAVAVTARDPARHAAWRVIRPTRPRRSPRPRPAARAGRPPRARPRRTPTSRPRSSAAPESVRSASAAPASVRSASPASSSSTPSPAPRPESS